MHAPKTLVFASIMQAWRRLHAGLQTMPDVGASLSHSGMILLILGLVVLYMSIASGTQLKHVKISPLGADSLQINKLRWQLHHKLTA